MSVPNKIEGDDKIAFLAGEYFCFTSDVWGIQDKQFTSDRWKDFSGRRGAVEIPVRNSNATIDPYKLTRKALETGTAPAPAKSTRSDNTSDSEVKKSIWPVDIVGEPKVVNKIHEVAHLLPAGEQDHEEWLGVAAAVLGLPQNSTVADELMATRGVHTEGEENQDHVTKQKAQPKAARAPPQMPAKSSKPSPGKASMPPAHERQADSSSSEDSVYKNRKKRKKSRKRGRPGIQGKSPRAAKKGKKGKGNVTFSPDASLAGSEKKGKQRVAHTGVVHFVSNKIRMASQKHLLDGSNPTMLIIPCYTLQQAKDWKGEGYRAVILTGPPDFKSVHPPDGYSDRDLGKDAFGCFGYARMNTRTFLERYEKVRAVNKREQGRLLHVARQSLEDTILGLTQYVKDMTNQDLTPLCPSKRAALQKRANSLQDKTKTIVPKHGKDPEKPLLLVTFGAQSETPRTSHPAPDPLLLLAAKMTGTSLLAVAEPNEEEEIDSLDELAEEDFYQRFCQSQDAKIPKEISVLSPYIHA